MKNEINQILWYLEGELKDNSPWIVPVHNNIFSIGRLDSSDLILSSSSVSRKHAQLIIESDELYIKDLNSKNGTYINGKLNGDKTILHNGDLLKIGISEFKVFSKEIVEKVKDNNTMVGLINNKKKSFTDFYQLSERESDVLFFLIKGHSLNVIGEKLFISTGTVKNHVLKIYKKTDSHSRIELSTKYTDFIIGS